MIRKFRKFWIETLLMIEDVKAFDDVKFGQLLIVFCFVLSNVLNVISIILFSVLILKINWFLNIGYGVLVLLSLIISIIIVVWVYVTLINQNKFKKQAKILGYHKDKRPFLVYFLLSIIIMLSITSIGIFFDK